MSFISRLTKLIDSGFPPEVAEKIVSGELPMDRASRMERAREQGYDPDDIQYHGTEADIKSFIPSAKGKMGPGVYTSPNQSTANTFSGYPSPFAEGANVMPLLTRGDYIDNADAIGLRPDISGKEGQRVLNENLETMGYSGRQAGVRGSLSPEKVTFDPRNIRSVNAAFDPDYKGSNILGSAVPVALGTGIALLGSGEAEAGPVKAVKDLLFLHNTNADKLVRQSAMGGLPNPSIAVTQRDVPFEGFGDITLVGKPEAFDPKLRSNPLFSADAYTVRAPSPVRVAKKDAYKKFNSDFTPYRDFGNIDDVAYSLGDLEKKTRLEPSDFRRVNDFLEYDNAAALKFADDVGIKLSNKDYHEISQMKRDNADKYQEWKDGVLDEYFQEEEFFVTNPDFDRYQGRAKLKPYTADNVSRYMTRQAGANKESTMTFGAGNIRASTAERISSLPKAREMKGLLKPADAIAEVKETASSMLGDLQTALRDYYKYDTSSFRYFDEVGEMIALSERKGVKRAMEEIGFENVPDSLVKEIDDYKDYLRSAPTEYFESKPQRAVQLTDFAGAIVPEKTPKNVLDMLSRAGLKVEKYNDEATRTEARKKFQNYMFDAAPTIGGVGLAGLAGLAAPDIAQAGEIPIEEGIGKLPRRTGGERGILEEVGDFVRYGPEVGLDALNAMILRPVAGSIGGRTAYDLGLDPETIRGAQERLESLVDYEASPGAEAYGQRIMGGIGDILESDTAQRIKPYAEPVLEGLGAASEGLTTGILDLIKMAEEGKDEERVRALLETQRPGIEALQPI